MLTELCQELHNWFDRERYTGTFEIAGGEITADFLKPGQYYRVIGSIFNDGVHRYGDAVDELVDEEWTGAVWALAIPNAVIELATAIQEWRDKYEGVDSVAMSPYTSESFGGYSYSKSGSSRSGSSSGGPMSWKDVFAGKLNAWRKLQ